MKLDGFSRCTWRLVCGASLLVVTGCATTMAEVPTSDGNVLVVQGYGTKSMVAQKCLSADAIQKLVDTQIPDAYKGQSCYWVVLISSDSTDISRAVTSFIGASQEFDDKVALLAAPGAPKPSDAKKATPAKAVAIETASTLLANALTNNADELVTMANKLPADQKTDVKLELTKARAGVTDPVIRKKLDAILSAP